MRSRSCAIRQFLPGVLSKFANEARQGGKGGILGGIHPSAVRPSCGPFRGDHGATEAR